MQMKSFAMIAVIPLLSFPVFSQTSGHKDKGNKYPSCYKEGITVNGNSQEWENSLFSFNKQAQVNYAIVNDTAAIYICARIANEAAQMKVLRSGIEVQFNSKGKKKPEATVHFPMGGDMNRGEHRDRKTMHLMYLLQMQDMDLTGFRGGVNGFQNIKSGKNGILAAVNWDSANVMVYEAKIPFSVFAADVRAAVPLSVGIIIKGATKPREAKGDAMPEGGTGDMQGGHGQGRPGGMRPGGTGMDGQEQGAGDNTRMYEDDEIWRSIVIAKKE